MSPFYSFRESRCVCTKCGGRTEIATGPDGIDKVRCQDCDWWETYDPAADKFAIEELERRET